MQIRLNRVKYILYTLLFFFSFKRAVTIYNTRATLKFILLRTLNG